ncbi:MAG: hypothetical protein OXB86_04265 [Bdellovibrionales bacterium]|nr:hypothetical protein [Bdellovibrionales bacterium]
MKSCLVEIEIINKLYRYGFSFLFFYLSFRNDFQGQREVKTSNMRFATKRLIAAFVSKPNSLLTSL